MSQIWDRLRFRGREAPSALVTLELQAQLGRLAAEVRRADGHDGFAGAHHTRAAVAAYEHTLRRALRHAGGELTACEGDVIALELELASRGWSW